MSLGRRLWKRIVPSVARSEPAPIDEPEHEQRVREQGAEDGELRHDELARRQREDDDEELGQVAEGRLQHAGDRRAEA